MMILTTAKDYAAITNLDQLKRLVDRMVSEDKSIGFDLETGYLGEDFKKRSVDHYHKDQFVVGFSFTNSTEWARYVPIAHDDGPNLSPDQAWEVMRPLLTTKRIVAHNAKFELAAVRKAANYVLGSDGGVLICTMLGAFNVGAASINYRTQVDLKGLIKSLFGHEMMHIHDLWPGLAQSKRDFIRFNTLQLTPEVISYACEDALWALALDSKITPWAEEERGFIQQLEHKIMFIVEDMERKGTSIDWSGLEAAYAKGQAFSPIMEQSVKDGLGELAGRDLSDLNLKSPKQLQRVLFHDIGMATTRLSRVSADKDDLEAWQKMSTDKKSLVSLSHEYEPVKNLLEYREVQNLLNRCKKWLSEYNNCFDGKVHAKYKQAASETNDDTSNTAPGSGRFSSTDPAIQQLPKKWFWEAKGEQWKGNFRDFIVASPDSYYLTFDYSQVELRMLAGASQELALLDGFMRDDDMHTLTAAMLLGIDPFDVDPDVDRPLGKVFNFALMYGMGPKSLGEQLGIPFERAKFLYKEYFKIFSSVSSWMNSVRNKGLKLGYAETIFGRKIPVWQLKHEKPGVQAQGARVLVNGPIQGSAADYMKIAMLRAASTLKKEGLWYDKVTIVTNLHDALTFEVDNSIDANELRDLLHPRIVFDASVAPVLEGYPSFKVDWELGHTWGSGKKWSYNQKAGIIDGAWSILPEPEVSFVKLLLPENPTEKSYRDFITTVKQEPGNTRISLYLPEGSVDLPFTASVTKTKANELRKIFKNATMEVQ